jgi:hypothetical protein
MYQTTVRCKSLRLAERHKNNEAHGIAVGERLDVEEYTEASLEGGDEKSHFFFSFPVSLLDADMKIGDEILVTFERKNR